MPATAILRAGRNCWKIAGAERLALLVDGESYFSALADACERARRRIVLIGWDFDSRLWLRPNGERIALGAFLRRLVEARPELDIHILIWRNSFLYASNSEIPELFEPDWSDHPRIHFRTDDSHPVGACRHTKIACIDGKLAFVGGMDLTRGRWDDRDHLPENPDRTHADGTDHMPIHDVQMVVDGAAARVVCEISDMRWQKVSGDKLPPIGVRHDPWPRGLRPTARRQSVGVARTVPAHGDHKEIREVEALNEDMIAAAEELIYVEAQYFALPRVAEVMAESLSRPKGPEIVLVVNAALQGIVESYVMAENRDRLFSFLHDADRHSRLRTFHPVARPEPVCPVRVHAKVGVIDDRLLRVGSANLNARSTGLDDECDLVVEASDARGRQAIRAMRDDLLAEHLGVPPGRLARTIRSEGSVIAAIDRLNTGERRLVPYDVAEWDGGPLRVAGSPLLDPSRAFDLDVVLDTFKASEP